MRTILRAACAFALLAPGISARVNAQHVDRDSASISQLEKLIEEVRTNNPTLSAARFHAEAVGTTPSQVRTLPDPQVMLTVLPAPIYTARGKQRSQLRIEQGIPFPGKSSQLNEIRKIGAEIADQEHEILEDGLVLEVKQAFYEIYRAVRSRELISSFQSRLEEFEQIAASRYEVGQGTQQAILQAQLERNLLSHRLIGLAREENSAREVIARLINRPLDFDELVAIERIAPPTITSTVYELEERAMQSRPEVSMTRLAVRQAEANHQLARKQFYPDFGVSLSYFDIAESDIPQNADGKNALAVGFRIKVPLQRASRRAKEEETALAVNRVDAQAEAWETAVRSSVRDLTAQLHEDKRQLELLEQTLMPQAESTVKAGFSAYTTGQTNFLSLLDSERVRFNLQVQIEETLARYLKTIARLEQALALDSIEHLN